jgi:hypothetical protein
MCLIINNESGQTIAPEIIDDALRLNPHGFGFVDLETMKVQRTMSTKRARKLLASERPFVAHCRYATAGVVSKQNVHPFPFGNGRFLLMMNGTVRGFEDTTTVSDTRRMAQAMECVKRKDFAQFLALFRARFLVIDLQRGDVQMIGSWHTHNRVFYSKPQEAPRPPRERVRKWTGDIHAMEFQWVN